MPAPPVSLRVKLMVVALLLVGVSLRLWNIGDGVRHTPGVDEPAITEKALNSVKTGDFNPKYFHYPGLMFHLETAVIAVRFLEGSMSRGWKTFDSVWEGDFYLWCRVVVALLGTLTIYVVFRTGLRWGTTVGLVAALAMAVQPLHVRESHYALTDTPLTLFVALTLLMSVRASEDGRTRIFLLAGLMAGLAAATKYNGLLAVLMPLSVALFATTTRPRVWAMAAAAGGCVAGFLIGSPYSLIALPDFLLGFADLASSYNQPTSVWTNVSTYQKHLIGSFAPPDFGSRFLKSLLTWPAGLLLIVGIVITAWRLRSRATRPVSFAILVFTGVYFWFIANQSLLFARYALPLLPMLCLFLALGIASARNAFAGTTASERARRLALAALLLLLAMPMAQSISANLERGKVDTKEQAAAWIVENTPKGARVVIEGSDIRFSQAKLPSINLGAGLLSMSVAEYRKLGVVFLVSHKIDLNAYTKHPDYREFREATEHVQTFSPSIEHPGDLIMIFKIR